MSTERTWAPRLATRRIVLLGTVLASVLVVLAMTGCGRGAEPPPDETADLLDSAETDPAETEIPQEDDGDPASEPAPTPPADVQVNLAEELAEGDEGANVEQLQRALETLGIDPGPIDGIFGPRTKAAVVVFQEQHNLENNGVADEETLLSINEALSQEVG